MKVYHPLSAEVIQKKHGCSRTAELRRDGVGYEPGQDRNIPALDTGAQILAELRGIRQRLDRIESILDAADYNAVARFTNNTMAVRTDNQLIPLKTQGFPMTLVDIDRANSAELNRLLESYGLPTVGTVAVRRTQLKNYLGIAVEGA